jgi:nucleotide-binding universal stress UspA family protein
MYDRILVAVDHSELSDRAVLAARDLATLSHGEVWVLHPLPLTFRSPEAWCPVSGVRSQSGGVLIAVP